MEYQWQTLESNTTSALIKWAKAPSVKPGYRPVVLMTVLCGSLHAVQDFYSHSNWLKRVARGRRAADHAGQQCVGDWRADLV